MGNSNKQEDNFNVNTPFLDALQVELKQRLQVYVNKTEVDLPFIKLGQMSIIQRGYSLVVTTSLGVTIIWDGLSYLEV